MNILFNKIRIFYREFGFFSVIFAFFSGILSRNTNYLLFGIFLVIDICANVVLKKIAHFVMGNKKFPIIGSGLRPFGLNTTVHTTYGMPSGHSQNFAFVATLFGLHLNNKKVKYKKVKYGILVFLTILAMYMRVYVEKCHTVQQTIVGATIGIIFAIVLKQHFGNPLNMT